MNKKFLDKSTDEELWTDEVSSGEGSLSKDQERLLKFKLSFKNDKKFKVNKEALENVNEESVERVDLKRRADSVVDNGVSVDTRDNVEFDNKSLSDEEIDKVVVFNDKKIIFDNREVAKPVKESINVDLDSNIENNCLVKDEKKEKISNYIVDTEDNLSLKDNRIVIDKRISSEDNRGKDVKNDEFVSSDVKHDSLKDDSVEAIEAEKGRELNTFKNASEKELNVSVKDVNREVKNKCVGIIKRKDVSKLNDEEKSERIVELGQKILSEIDLKLEKDIFKLNEIIREQNLLVESCQTEQDLDKLEQIRKEYEELYRKFKEFTKQVELLYENYDFEKIIDLNEFSDNQILVNDIIEFRDLLDNSDPAVELVEQYKLLDNFVMLHREIFLIEERIKKNTEKQDKKIERVKDRDENYSLFQEKLDGVSRVDSECKLIIDKQNDYVKALFNRINHISSERVIEYQVRGINNLLETTILYVALLAANIQLQLSGRGMTARAMATRRMLANIRRQMNQDPLRVEKIRYQAEDFENEIFAHIDDLGSAIKVIDETIGDIGKYRKEFEEKYKGIVTGYEEVLSKLNEVEKMVFDSKQKALAVQAKLEESEKINSDKLVRVKALNENNH